MAYYNNQTQNATPEAGRDVWQRQQDILAHLKNAEETIFKGIELQNPVYDAEYGIKRNLYSVSTLLTGAKKYHFIIQSLLTNEKSVGLGSDKDIMYKQGFAQVEQLMNQAVNYGLNSLIGLKKLNEAYEKVMGIIYLLREEVSSSELDFKKKKNVYDAWKD